MGYENCGKYLRTEKHKQISIQNLSVNFHKLGKDNPFFGKHHTEEAIKKNSEKHKGKNNSNWGKHRNEETKRKISEANSGNKNPMYGKHPIGMRGKKHTTEVRQKMSESHKGEKSYLWKGGITPINQKIRKGIDIRLWRELIFQRDGFLCQMPDCDKTERYLNAHHIMKFADYPELRFEVSNGITLCKKCHDKIQWKEEKFENMFIEIVKLKIINLKI